MSPARPDTIRSIDARAVSIPMRRPLQTSSGDMPVSPLVLIDLRTAEGVTGRWSHRMG